MRLKFGHMFLISLFFVALLVSPFKSFAHTAPISYEPEDGSIVENPPDWVFINFNERVEESASSITILGPDGLRADLGDAQVEKDGRKFGVGLLDRGEGTYHVSWSTVSLEEGHLSEGGFSFSLGKKTAAVGHLDTASIATNIYKSSLAEGLIIWLELLGQASLLGIFVLFAFVYNPIRKKYPEQFNNFTDTIEKRFNLIACLGIGLNIIGFFALMITKSMDLQLSLQAFLKTAVGGFGLYRAIIGIIFLSLFLIVRKKVWIQEPSVGFWTLFCLVLSIILIRVRVGHSAASYFPALSVATTFLQLVAKEFWVGGLLVIGSVFVPILNKIKNKSVTIDLFVGFSKLTSVSLLLIGIGGAFIVWQDLKDPANLFTSPWGRKFIFLIILAGVLVGLRLFQQLIVEKAWANQRDGAVVNWLNKLSDFSEYIFSVEILVGVFLLFATSFLIITPPPLSSTGSTNAFGIFEAILVIIVAANSAFAAALYAYSKKIA